MSLDQMAPYSASNEQLELFREEDRRIHRKLWGEELWIVNNDRYCGKRLLLKAGWQCSLHWHRFKQETFFVATGWVRFENGVERFDLGPGQQTTVYPGIKHRFAGLTDAVIFEFSTTHDESDVERLEQSRRMK